MTTKVAMAFIQGDDRFREHIFGILVEVQMEWEGRYYTRPLPKSVFKKVRNLVCDDRWSREAKKLCEPSCETN